MKSSTKLYKLFCILQKIFGVLTIVLIFVTLVCKGNKTINIILCCFSLCTIAVTMFKAGIESGWLDK